MDFPRPDAFGNYLLKDFGDIVLPDAVPWWPLAPGWWVLLALILMALTLFAYLRYRHWRRNAYRRSALRALAHTENLRQVTGILKTAVHGAFPSDTVAPLWGEDWVAYLNSKTAMPYFEATDGERFNDLLSRPESHWPPDIQNIQQRVRCWLQQHQEEKL